MLSAEMPILARYKGVGIHDFQDEARIRTVVKPEIDYVLALQSADDLVRIIEDVYVCPEARLLAFKMLVDPAKERMEARRKAGVDIDWCKAWIGGVGRLCSSRPEYYGATRFMVPVHHSRPLPARPPEHQARMRAAQERARA